MADRRVLACHRITPYGLFVPIFKLMALGLDYRRGSCWHSDGNHKLFIERISHFRIST